MSITLENLITFVIILNIFAFIIYVLMFYKKKEKTINKGEVGVVLEKKEVKQNKVNVDNEAVKVTEVQIEMSKSETDEIQRLADELKSIHEENEEEYKPEIKPIVEVRPRADYDIEFEKSIKTERSIKTEVDVQSELQTYKEQEDIEENVEPFELLTGMDVEFVGEYVKEEGNKEVTNKEEKFYTIDNQLQDNIVSKEKRDYVEPKREIIDSMNILNIEGAEDEDEEEQSEIIVRHYEPFVYKTEGEDEEVEDVIVEEDEEENKKEEEDDDEIEKRMAYLTGEWTDDYIIQPKNKHNRKE